MSTLKEELIKLKQDLIIKSIEKSNGGNFLNIESYHITLNDGSELKREKLIKGKRDGSAAIIVPVTIDNKIILVIQPRVFTKEMVSIELPAGYIDEGETPEKAALRELREETGYVPQKIIEVASYYQDQGISSAYNHCFLAIGCEKKYNQELDKDEYIKYITGDINDVYELVEDNTINDANSIIALTKSKKYL